MHKSLVHWVLAQYRKTPPLAQDDDMPAASLTATMRTLGDRWLDRFDTVAPEIGSWFAKAARDRSDWTMADALRRGGISVRFQPSAVARDVVQATIAEQVALIRNIATQHIAAVEGAVNRSVQVGRDVGGLAKDLEGLLGISKRRAQTIARHQNGIATASFQRIRQQELGITEAVWIHSGAGRHPRPSHVAQSGKRYEIAKGWHDPDIGEWIWPGTAINCRCVMKSIIPGLD